MAALFDARGVTKRFGGLTALQAVDFALESGIASIIGPNGAGKTTLFNIFTGLYPADEGSVTFRGRALFGLRPDQITALGICRTFQNIRLFANMTVIENVLVGMNSRIALDRKSTRLNSSHLVISYAVFCLKKKKTFYM